MKSLGDESPCRWAGGKRGKRAAKSQDVLPGVSLILNVFFRNPRQRLNLFIMLGCLDYASLETTPHRLVHEGGELPGLDQL